jgi:hypothetical protein
MTEDGKKAVSLMPTLRLRVLDVYYELFELIGVVSLVILAVISVSEMASRESFSNSVQGKIVSINEELANISLSIPTSESDTKIPESLFKARAIAQDEMNIFSRLNDKITTLINSGVEGNRDTLRALTSEYQQAISNTSADKIESGSLLNSISSSEYIAFIYEMRSDHLLALAVICCSALGAMIYGLRSGTRMSVRSMTSGLATGFVVYLALKGGQHLFLLNPTESRIPANPYSSSFAGLLAGLFSDKAYKVLSSLVDDLASRVEKAAGNNNDGNNDTKS